MKNFIILIMLILGELAYGQDAPINPEYIDALKKLKNEATDTLSAEYFYNRAGIKYDFGNYTGSIEDSDKAHKLNPSSPKVLYNRGLSKLELRQYRDARDDFSAAIKIDPKWSAPITIVLFVNTSSRNTRLQLMTVTKLLKLILNMLLLTITEDSQKLSSAL